MPRRETPFVSDHYYHLYNRGNNRQAIFFQPENYLYFLRGVKKYLIPTVSMIGGDPKGFPRRPVSCLAK